MLSEKAKGKQRDVGLADVPPSSSEPKKLVIRFTEGVPDLTLYVEENDTIRDIKRNVSIRNIIILHSQSSLSI